MSPAPERTDALDWLRLCLVPGVSAAAQRALLKAFGSPTGIFQVDTRAHRRIVGDQAASALASGPAPQVLEATLTWLRERSHHLIALGDDSYPPGLLQISDPPTILFAIGNRRLLRRPAIAVVGSRNATRQGEADALAFSRALSDAGYTIVSGLALGIDTAAHRGGLAGRSSSIAVVATGLDRVYPVANRELAHELAERGIVLSEFAPGTPPASENFPRRNRIISALARGVLIVEAAIRSGSLITARLGLEQGRDVFAIPGSIHSPQSKGCHWLIKQGAKLVESAEDILGELGATASATAESAAALPSPPTEEPVLAALGFSPASLDMLALRTGSPIAELSAEITRLELEGHVERLSGGLFRRLVLRR